MYNFIKGNKFFRNIDYHFPKKPQSHLPEKLNIQQKFCIKVVALRGSIYDIRLLLNALRFLCYFTLILKGVKSAAQYRAECQHDTAGIQQINQSEKHNE
jgi:hypothetical protein